MLLISLVVIRFVYYFLFWRIPFALLRKSGNVVRSVHLFERDVKPTMKMCHKKAFIYKYKVLRAEGRLHHATVLNLSISSEGK